MGDDQVKRMDDETQWVMAKSNAWMMKHNGYDQVKCMDDETHG